MPGPYRRGCLKERDWQLHNHRCHSYLAAAEFHVCTSWHRIDDHLALARPHTVRSGKQKGSQRDSIEHWKPHCISRHCLTLLLLSGQGAKLSGPLKQAG